MRLLNKTLADLKVYARKKYSLAKNVPTLVMIVTEEEHKTLTETYTKLIEANNKKAITPDDGSTEEGHLSRNSAEFFPNVASIFELVHSYSKDTKPTVTPILRDAFDIPHFGKYRYAILIREDKLLEWGSKMDIQIEGKQATGKKRKLVIFYRILAQEFLHVIENQKGIQIFENNQKDTEIVQQALKAVKMFRDIDIFLNGDN